MKRIISSSIGERLSVAVVLLACLLVGCEAPLVLDGVEQEQNKAVRRSDNFLSLAVNDVAMVAVGNRGVTVVSSNSGQQWVRKDISSKPFLMDIASCPDNSFVALDYQAKIWRLTDINGDWQSREMGTVETPQAITCDSLGRIWVVGSFSSILRSDDAGESWTETSLDEDLHFTTVQFVDGNHGYLTGEFGVVARTVDGGESWEMLDPIPDEFYPQDAWFKTTQEGWVVGLNGTVLHTTDGGGSWQSQDTGSSDPIYSISANGGSLYAVGGNGLVLVCQGCVENGATAGWKKLDHGLPIRFYLRGIATLDGKLWIAGGSGALHGVELGNAVSHTTINNNRVAGGAE